MVNRPIIELSLSPLDERLESAGWLLFWAYMGFSVYAFLQSPSSVPVHFDLSGKPDGYAGKWSVLALPALGAIIYMGITQINKYPHVFNYFTAITPANAPKQYALATRMLRFLKLAILLIFIIISVVIHLNAIGLSCTLGRWFLPLSIGILLLPAILQIVQSVKAGR